MSYHRYLCGCYYGTDDIYGRGSQTYLPLLNTESQTSLISTSYRTKLKQFFKNPSATDIKECIYTFPLYDGVALVSFKCQVGDRTLHGVVKEKNKAKEVYDEAVAQGQTAGLLAQLPEASDVFSTKLGNIPADETVTVEIEYVGELKQEAETNGIRFTIPTNIAPRYGSVTSGSTVSSVGSSGIKIVVDAQMPAGSTIQGLQSPSHPIAIALGTLSKDHADSEASLSKASASLSINSTSLDKDFVLVVLAKDTATPRAILETHPTIENQKALMVTLVPKFSLLPSRPEIVFVADRSGSMGGNIPILISAMKVFLKSLPVGVKFNICSFGSRHEFLWPKSKTYAQDTLTEAMSYVERFDANFGGTETFSAIKATIEKRFTDIPLEVMLLTDGDIWQQEELFRYLNEEVEKSQGNIRVFPLGIGSGVSHALIEGVARAGNGFAQAVQDGEKLDNRVVRMLKGALSPHITDYTLEVKCKYEQPVGDDFEMIEKFDKVTDGFQVSTTEVLEEEKPKEQKAISLFDSKVDPDAEDKATSSDKSGQDRYAHLPATTLPKLMQAPHKMPSLFPFTRTSVYLLMTPAHGSSEPESVILRGTSSQGPLELEIPVDVLPEPADTIHQLAAKKAVQDLEEGRGWIIEAKDEKGVLIKDRYPSKFDDMVEREAVRLGTQFGIAGKWCSFVAVTDNNSTDESGKITGNAPSQSQVGGSMVRESAKLRSYAARHCAPKSHGSLAPSIRKRSGGVPYSASMSSGPPAPSAPVPFGASMAASPGGGLFGAPNVPQDMVASGFGSSQGLVTRVGAPPDQRQASKTKKSGMFGGGFGGALFGSSRSTSASASPAASSLSETQSARPMSSDLFVAASRAATAAAPSPCAPPPPQQYQQQLSYQFIRRNASNITPVVNAQDAHYSEAAEDDDDDEGFGNLDGVANYTESAGDGRNPTDWTKASDEDKVHKLIALQDFVGFWEYAADMYGIMSLKGKDYKRERTLRAGDDDKVWTTVLVIVFLEQKMKAEEGVWDLVVEKARSWLEGMKGEREREVLEVEARAVFA
ncbi:hypothetical protein MMC30_006398 [Trapelia coarctata]|nr:hypothetical protein [Trapelia coarctata]